MTRLLTATAMTLTLGLATPISAEEPTQFHTEKVWKDYQLAGYTRAAWRDRNPVAAATLTLPALLGDILAPAYKGVVTPFALAGDIAKITFFGLMGEALAGNLPEPHAPQPDFAADHRACMETMKNHSRNGRVGKGTERYCNRLAAKGIRPTPWVTPKLFK